MPPSFPSTPIITKIAAYLNSSNISIPLLNSTIHTSLDSQVWRTQPQEILPQQRTLDLVMILFVSIFLFLTAAVLRLMPATGSATSTRLHRRGREVDRIITYSSPFTYGAVENITHVQSMVNARSTRSRPPTYEALIDLEDRIGQAKVGFTDEQIAVLPTYPCSEDVDQEQLARRGHTCAICRDKYSIGQILTLLPCGDEFHTECITPWLKLQATCPLCRCRFA